jgi:hypothetical protein
MDGWWSMVGWLTDRCSDVGRFRDFVILLLIQIFEMAVTTQMFNQITWPVS